MCFFYFLKYHSSLKKPWRMTAVFFGGVSVSVQYWTIFFMWWCERLVSHEQLCSRILRDQLIKNTSAVAAILLLQESLLLFLLLPPPVVHPAVCIGSCWSLVFGLRYSNLLPPAGCSWSIYDFCLLSGYRADAEDATCSAELLLPPSAQHEYHSWCRSDSSLCWIFLTGLI